MPARGRAQSIFLEEKAEEIAHIAAKHGINPIICDDVGHSSKIYLIEAATAITTRREVALSPQLLAEQATSTRIPPALIRTFFGLDQVPVDIAPW